MSSGNSRGNRDREIHKFTIVPSSKGSVGTGGLVMQNKQLICTQTSTENINVQLEVYLSVIAVKIAQKFPSKQIHWKTLRYYSWPRTGYYAKYDASQNKKENINLLYLVEAASSRVLLAGPELLKLCVQDVHQLLHEPDAGADVAGKHRAVRVARQLIGQVRRVLSTPDLPQFRAEMCDYKGHKLHGGFNAGNWQRKLKNHVDKLCSPIFWAK